MSLKLYEEESVRAIADAIRAKNGSVDNYRIADMPGAIADLGGGIERLFYVKCVNNDQTEIPAISNLVQGAHYSDYLSYDSTTKKFTVLHDFTAVIIGWVYTYQTYESSRSNGAFYANGVKLIDYQANGNSAGSIGGKYAIYPFKANDTFWVYTPTRDGYPQQNAKVYMIAPLPDDIYTFADEEA